MVLAEAETAAARPGLPRRLRWRRFALLTVGLACVIVAVLAAVASRYQPIGNGEDLGFAFPGLPAGQGFRVVNNLGGFHQDIYVPPQRRTFALVATIMNNGTHRCLKMCCGWKMAVRSGTGCSARIRARPWSAWMERPDRGRSRA